jgi:hypothetical protein
MLAPRKEYKREGDPGALHHGAGGARIDGHGSGRRRSVELTMKTFFKVLSFRVILALSALASSALVLEAGRRWSN